MGDQRGALWLTGAVVSAACSVAGVVSMDRLADRADRARHWACATGDAGQVRWEKGFSAWLPILTVTTAVVAVVLLVAVIAFRRTGSRLPGLAAFLLVGVLPLALFSGLLLHDFYAYPGADMTTVASSPCGAG